jgi:hypothetical protein
VNPAFANALNASDSFCFLYVVEDTSLTVIVSAFVGLEMSTAVHILLGELLVFAI